MDEHQQHQQSTAENKEHIDPVCGMTVVESPTAITAEYKGKTYYFCAPGCKTAFEKNPEQYLQPSS